MGVYLNDTQQMLTEVPVTPATRVVDVVEYCKEAGEGECHLAEKWNGHERVLPQQLLLLDLLQQWGARRPEVSFYLRHCPSLPQGTAHILCFSHSGVARLLSLRWPGCQHSFLY
uniref:Apoptosis-stimulating of p53 protein 2-like RA domain-containing protein n=1 Tax=Hippocampus comes TaxID=109280 RepID=A0A3Q2YF48_HIPCM